MLALPSNAAGGEPMLCIVDDAQWLDRSSAQALAFAARRLNDAAIVFLLAESGADGPAEFAGLPELVLDRLSDRSARELFSSVIPGNVDEAVAARIIAETRGNPGALRESLGGVSPAEFAGGFRVRATARQPPRGAGASLEDLVSRLPSDSQRLLLAAAADGPSSRQPRDALDEELPGRG
jgi:hypothetical protein